MYLSVGRKWFAPASVDEGRFLKALGGVVGGRGGQRGDWGRGRCDPLPRLSASAEQALQTPHAPSLLLLNARLHRRRSHLQNIFDSVLILICKIPFGVVLGNLSQKIQYNFSIHIRTKSGEYNFNWILLNVTKCYLPPCTSIKARDEFNW